jgi:hypothetical protein
LAAEAASLDLDAPGVCRIGHRFLRRRLSEDGGRPPRRFSPELRQLGSSVFYAFGIKGGELSVLYPMVSLGYIWTLLWSKLFFNEPFTRNKFLGLGLILLGVFFVGLGS